MSHIFLSLWEEIEIFSRMGISLVGLKEFEKWIFSLFCSVRSFYIILNRKIFSWEFDSMDNYISLLKWLCEIQIVHMFLKKISLKNISQEFILLLNNLLRLFNLFFVLWYFLTENSFYRVFINSISMFFPFINLNPIIQFQKQK